MTRLSIFSALALLLAAAPALANRVFVSNERGNDVTVLDSDTLEVIGHYPVGARPRGIAISPDGKELYVCASDDDLVRVFDPQTMQGFIETSNVNVVQEITSLITAQRAYEMNSKVIQTSDEMLQRLSQL